MLYFLPDLYTISLEASDTFLHSSLARSSFQLPFVSHKASGRQSFRGKHAFIDSEPRAWEAGCFPGWSCCGLWISAGGGRKPWPCCVPLHRMGTVTSSRHPGSSRLWGVLCARFLWYLPAWWHQRWGTGDLSPESWQLPHSLTHPLRGSVLFHSLCGSQNRSTGRAGRDHRGSPGPTACSNRIIVLRTVFRQLLRISREGNSTASLRSVPVWGHLHAKFFLICRWNFFCPLSPVLVLGTIQQSLVHPHGTLLHLLQILRTLMRSPLSFHILRLNRLNSLSLSWREIYSRALTGILGPAPGSPCLSWHQPSICCLSKIITCKQPLYHNLFWIQGHPISDWNFLLWLKKQFVQIFFMFSNLLYYSHCPLGFNQVRYLLFEMQCPEKDSVISGTFFLCEAENMYHVSLPRYSPIHVL